jgi:hypothetical protein
MRIIIEILATMMMILTIKSIDNDANININDMVQLNVM